MAPRKPPKILLDTDPVVPSEGPAPSPAADAVLLPPVAEAPSAVLDGAAPTHQAVAEPLAEAAETVISAAAQAADEASQRAAEAVGGLADQMVATAEAAATLAAGMVAPPSVRSDAVPAGPDADARMTAAFDVPRLVGGFLERQTRRTMDGAVGFARCRSLPALFALQGTLIRDSLDDLARSNTEIAVRSIAALTGRRTTVC